MQSGEQGATARDDSHMLEEAYDVVVVGSGAAALLAAVRVADAGADVLVIEKENRFGGNSAMSGGGIWVPNNSGMASIHIADSPEDAFAYLRAVIPDDQISDATIQTYLQTAPLMIEYLRQVGVPYTPVEKYPAGKQVDARWIARLWTVTSWVSISRISGRCRRNRKLSAMSIFRLPRRHRFKP